MTDVCVQLWKDSYCKKKNKTVTKRTGKTHGWAEIEVIKNKMDVDGVWMLKIMKTDSAYVQKLFSFVTVNMAYSLNHWQINYATLLYYSLVQYHIQSIMDFLRLTAMDN